VSHSNRRMRKLTSTRAAANYDAVNGCDGDRRETAVGRVGDDGEVFMERLPVVDDVRRVVVVLKF
jgi:hypothetical protein